MSLILGLLDIQIVRRDLLVEQLVKRRVSSGAFVIAEIIRIIQLAVRIEGQIAIADGE